MSLAIIRTRTRALVVAAVLAALAVFASGHATPAYAAAAVGASGTCHNFDVTKCVTGQGAMVAAGTSVTGAKAVVECLGAATRSSIIQITCTLPDENVSETRSFDGTAAASAFVPTVTGIDPKEVCWEVVATFADPFGPQVTVIDKGCAILQV